MALQKSTASVESVPPLDDEELIQEFIVATSIGVLAASYGGMVATLADIVRYRNVFAVCLTAFVLFLVALLFRAKRLFFSCLIYLFAPPIFIYLLLRFTGNPIYAYIAPISVITVFQISLRLGTLSLLLNTVALVLGLPKGYGIHPVYIFLWVSAGVEFVSTTGRMTVLRWARDSQEQANRLLVQLHNERGELNRTMEALTEATRRLQRLNQELKVARQEADEARATKEQFVANVSHELRTPLNLILGFVEIMYLNPETYEGVVWTPELVNDLREVYRAGRHLQSLVDDVLDLSRIDALRLPMFREMQPIQPIVEEAMATLAPLLKQRGLSWQVHYAEDLPPLFVDRTRIRQVLINVLNNAARFTDKGGIVVSVTQENESIHVSVSDTGVGIPPDKLEVIFEEFRQADPSPKGRGGAGLGLALSRRFIQLHGGRMWAESQVSQGTTVHFTIPLPGTSGEFAPLEYRPMRIIPADQPAPIVIVDADPSLADMLKRYLGDRRVLWAHSVAEAERLIENEHPAAVIINMAPLEEDSRWFEVAGQTFRRYNVPIIRCSIPSPSWLQALTGMDECLTKPISSGDLLRVMTTQCPEAQTILVIDDDTGFVALMERMLKTVAPKARVISAYSGAQGLQLAATERPDLIFLDLAMPEMDGFEVIERLRQEHSLGEAKIVGVTATSYAEEALARKGERLTLLQPRGLATGNWVAILNALLQYIEPDYVAEEPTRESTRNN